LALRRVVLRAWRAHSRRVPITGRVIGSGTPGPSDEANRRVPGIMRPGRRGPV
jgi:hypothetical protein